MADIGRVEESLGDNAIAAGFRGVMSLDRSISQWRYRLAILNSSFDWNGVRSSFRSATENDSLTGVANVNGGPAHRHRSDICRCPN
ncbi:hypothetical protein ACNKHN_15965 [Shigella flexneri]